MEQNQKNLHPQKDWGYALSSFGKKKKPIGTTRTMRREEIESVKKGKTGVTERKRKRKRNPKNERLREAK